MQEIMAPSYLTLTGVELKVAWITITLLTLQL